MKDFDHDYVEDLLERLKSIKLDARPAWGSLTRDGVIAHFTDTIRYSMGRLGDLTDGSNWLSRSILKFLILNRIVSIPKNVKAPPYENNPAFARGGDLETLHAVLDEYLNLVQAGELEPKPHPFFGELGVDGWARMHVLHFEHHFRQFGV